MADAPAAAQPEPQPRSRPRRRWLRWVGGGAAVLLVVVLLVVAAAPAILSSGPGTRFVAETISDGIAGSVTIDEASFGWFGGQRLRDVRLYDPGRELVAHVERLDAPDLGLLPAAFGSRAFGEVDVVVREAHIRQAAGRPTNLEEAIDSGGPAEEERQAEGATALGDLSLNLRLRAGRVTYESPDVERVELDGLAVAAVIPDPQNIALTMEGDLRQAGEQGRIDAAFTVRDAFTAGGVLQLSGAVVDGRAEVTNLPVPMVDRLAGQDGLLVALLGERLTATVETAGRLDELEAQIVARSERLTVDTQLVAAGDALRAREGSMVRLTLTPEAFAMLAGGGDEAVGEAGGEAVRLLQPATVNVALEDLVLPRVDGAVAPMDAAVRAAATSEPLLLDVPGQGRVALSGVRLNLVSSDLSEALTAALNATVAVGEGGAAEPVSAEVVVRNLLTDEPLAATLTAERFPVALADAAAGQGGRLARTLGATLDADVDVAQTEGGATRFRAELAAPNLRGPVAGTYGADGAIALSTPEPLRLTVTPEAYRDWLPVQPGGWTLSEPAALTVDLDRLTYAAPAGDAGDAALFDPGRTSVVGTVGVGGAAFASAASNERVGVQGGEIEIAGENLAELLRVVANLRLDPAPGAAPGAPAGVVATETELRGLVSPVGQLQLAGATVASQTRVEGVPSGVIDSLAAQGGELAAVLGPVTSLSADVVYRPDGSGTTSLTLDTSNIKGTVPARITERGVVRLREDVELTVAVTPETSRVMLSKITPLLGSAVSAEVPVRLRIAQQGFAVPLRGFDWRRVSADAVLDTGRLTLRPEGFAGTLLTALAPVANIPLDANAYQAQLGALPLTITRGTLAYDGLRLGLAGIDFGFGGSVDLAARRYDLDMRLGGEALPRELQGLTIPLEGPFDNPLSERTLARAIGGAALNAGLQQGAEQLLGELLDRGERDRPRQDAPPEDQTISRPREDAQDEPERPRDGLGGLLDIVGGELERQGQRDEERRRRERQQQQQQGEGQEQR